MKKKDAFVMSKLLGKKILIFSPCSFNSGDKLKLKLETMGAEVKLFDEDIKLSRADKFFVRFISRKFLDMKITKYYSSIIYRFGLDYFDYVIFINPETVTIELIRQLRGKQNNAKFLLCIATNFSMQGKINEMSFWFDEYICFDQNANGDLCDHFLFA